MSILLAEPPSPPLPKRSSRKRPCTESFPLLTVLGMTPGCMTLRYADSQTPHSRAKPADAIGLLLFVAMTAQGQGSVHDARFIKLCTKNPVEIRFDDRDDGFVATYYGRWVTRSGDMGLWSHPTSMRIAA